MIRGGKRRQREFEKVALPYLEAVYQFAHSLTRDATAAEDLVQETFLHGFRSFARFEPGTNCKAWLFRICKNCFIDKFREKRRRPAHQEIALAEPAAHDSPHDVAMFERNSIENEEIFLDLFGDEVNRFVHELPEDFRQALLLCDLQALTYEEIAGVLEIPIGTVRSRISRARSFLRERLEGYAREYGYLKEPRR
ncbi:MAG: sigma-70 family RNA polymerase sigma factor [Planctomycetes bacterium]|nr:sigma-70 family RNA polymerase sigma factor [Planctomycetota bacterium]